MTAMERKVLRLLVAVNRLIVEGPVRPVAACRFCKADIRRRRSGVHYRLRRSTIHRRGPLRRLPTPQLPFGPHKSSRGTLAWVARRGVGFTIPFLSAERPTKQPGGGVQQLPGVSREYLGVSTVCPEVQH